MFQAILPLKGKILNVEKARIDKMLGHEEIQTLIVAVGCGIGADEFDVAKRRYGKIVIMCDADVDGSHIRTLLLTFFFRHMRPLVDLGHVYVAQPPLYFLKKAKKAEYVLNDAILNQKLTEWGLEGTSLLIRSPDGQLQRTITGEDLANLYRSLERMQAQNRILRRRGIDKRQLIVRHLDENGKLPTYRAMVQRPGEPAPVEYFGYSDEEFQQFVAEESRRVGKVEVQEAGLSMSSSGNGGGAVHRILRTDLSECRVLEEVIATVKSMGLSVEDYYAERVEGVDGTAPPARFVLQREDQKTVELDNLGGLVDAVRSLGNAGVEVRRFKGLGEMDAEQLWSTTMDPQKRTLLKVVISEDVEDDEQFAVDAEEASRMFSILMGDDVEARREFIETNAANVKNLDV